MREFIQILVIALVVKCSSEISETTLTCPQDKYSSEYKHKTHNKYLTMTDSTEELYSVDFEIFGMVQGVFFRKYTQTEASKLGLKGWCKNTNNNTVTGVMQGKQNQVNEMKSWLQHTGSPQSRIDRAVFSELKKIKNYDYNSFSVKH